MYVDRHLTVLILSLATCICVKISASPITNRHETVPNNDFQKDHSNLPRSETPAIFLELDLVESTEGHLGWRNASRDHYIRGNIELTDNGRIRIHQAGYYSIFSAILFDSYSARHRPHRPLVAYHGIKLYRFGSQKTLIFNKTTLGRAMVIPSQTGPLYYYLDVGEEIKIVVNNVNLIYDSESNFVNVVFMFEN
ncbi:uncharacterized protein [Argopecten irradians]|uniref:uncharacterized protein n=1 Tax=Argopecten irradians TaxID=31199 RepID=UPI0037152BB3